MKEIGNGINNNWTQTCPINHNSGPSRSFIEENRSLSNFQDLFSQSTSNPSIIYSQDPSNISSSPTAEEISRRQREAAVTVIGGNIGQENGSSFGDFLMGGIATIVLSGATAGIGAIVLGAIAGVCTGAVVRANNTQNNNSGGR